MVNINVEVPAQDILPPGTDYSVNLEQFARDEKNAALTHLFESANSEVGTLSAKSYGCLIKEASGAVLATLIHWRPWRGDAACRKSEAREVLLQGKIIQLEAEEARVSLNLPDWPQPLTLSLKGKAGLALGAAAALTGAGLCLRQAGRDARNNHFTPDYGASEKARAAPDNGLQRIFHGVPHVKSIREGSGPVRRHIAESPPVQNCSDIVHVKPQRRCYKVRGTPFSHPPGQASQPEIRPLDKRRFIIAPYLDDKGAGNIRPTTLKPTENNAVKIEKLYDFSCIDKRKDLSWVDIIRLVGVTLGSPLKTLAEESQIIHHQNTLHQGCPPNDNSQHLADIAGQVDTVLTQVLSLLPSSSPLCVLQLMIGPALEVFANQLDGKQVDWQKITNINKQLILMARQTIPTLAPDELMMLYDKTKMTSHKPASGDAEIIKKRFAIKDGELTVKIQNQEYLFKEDASGVSYVQKDGAAEIIIFNTDTDQWEFAKKINHQDVYQKKLKLDYGMEIKKLPENGEFTIHDYDAVNNLFTFTKDKVSCKSVLMDGFIIPVEQFKLEGRQTVTLASPSNRAEMRVLLKEGNSWFFEAESTLIDENLGLLLASKGKGASHLRENMFTNIQDDGFSYDKFNRPQIKYKNKYSHVSRVTDSIYMINDIPGNFFVKENGYFTLQSSDDIIKGHEREIAGDLRFDSRNSVYIEREAQGYLLAQGKLTDSSPKVIIGPGVYLDAKGSVIFSTANNNFEVVYYKGGVLEVKRGYDDGSKNIALYFDEGTYFRVRKENDILPKKYKKLSGCKQKRSPGALSKTCLPVMMTESLNKLLKNEIIRGNTSNKTLLDKAITSSQNDDFPNLKYSTENGKFYFLHEGCYFSAEWISKGNTLNPTGKPAIKLYAKGNIFRKHRDIAIITSEIKDGKYELKTTVEYISEKLNIDEMMAEDFNHKRRYRRISGLDSLSNAVRQVNLSGKHYFSKTTTKFTPDTPDDTLKTIIRKKFYPERVVNNPDNLVEILGAKEVSPSRPYYLRAVAAEITQHIQYIREELLPVVLIGLNSLSENYRAYFGKIFKTDDANFLINFSARLYSRLSKISSNLSMSKIYLCALHNNAAGLPSGQKPVEEYSYQQILTANERQQGTFATTLTDSSKRIFINTDKLYFIDPTAVGHTLSEESSTDVVTTLIHEGSHIGLMATDIVYFPRNEGVIAPILDSIDYMKQAIRNNRIVNRNDFNRLNNEYFGSISVYKEIKNDIMQRDDLVYIIENDPAYLAHLLLNNADGLAILARDLYELS
ncbi:hypothetical protein [Erwinia pyrifoliae]|uniref:hypothetical protein n=1 Tax=Erwinia pyrifoliae TaxID=79967 RepID=UPI002209C1CD|nr:hypothetical protein [Erwinia pyrifoliae]UWS31091.1 hypothetical protein NYP81_06465 [Erwinia pyrifoliae]